MMKKPPTPDDHYAEWLREKQADRAPDGFSSSVMEAIDTAPLTITATRAESFAFWAKAAVFTLAAIVGVSRYALVIICLFFS